MASSRGESIDKYRSRETSIRVPISENDNPNKIDHYAVLAQVIDQAVFDFCDDPGYNKSLYSAKTLIEVQERLRHDMEAVVLTALTSEQFINHHQSLSASQEQRVKIDSAKWSNIEQNIAAGSTTFANSFSYLFSILQSHLGTDTASHPDNWRLLDRIAKLNINAFSAYYTTYLSNRDNWTAFIDQIELTSNGGVQFKPGFPKEAPISVVSTSYYARILTNVDLRIDGTTPLMQLKDVELSDDTIGCPVTFCNENLKKLWEIYASQAYRVTNEQALSSGDTEASAQ